MKRYAIPVNTIWPQYVNGNSQVYLASDVEAELVKREEEIVRLRKALGFYGDEENYDMREICWAPGHMCVRKEIESDRGSVAREALER